MRMLYILTKIVEIKDKLPPPDVYTRLNYNYL